MKPSVQWEEFDGEVVDDEPDGWISSHSELWRMVYRAVVIYLVLIISLGAVISLFGGNPLAYDGFLLKVLLFIVGLALLVSLANLQLEGEGQSIAGLMKSVSKPLTPRQERNKK